MSAATTSSVLAAEPNYYRSIKYPSPFFDLSTTYLPDNIKDLFQWCEFYFLTNPLVNTVITKLAEYPITDILIEHEDDKIRNKWERFSTDKLKLRSFCIETGWDYYTFGIAYVSLKFPFVKELKCPSCNTWFSAEGHKTRWKFHNLRFSFQCPKCGARSSPEVRDVYLKNIERVGLMRWNPKQVHVSYNELTGESNYYYKPPGTLVNDLQLGLKDVVVNTPQVIIEAIRHPGRSLELVKSNLYVLKRPSLSSKDTGYGVPAILPVLKDLYYLQVLKRAQEAIAMEHVIPLRTIFPQAASPSGDPIGTLNLTDWRREVRAELANWKKDPNYLPVLGFPLGTENIGGDGRALLLAQEIQTWSDLIVSGMGVPIELIRGGVSWCLDLDSYIFTSNGLQKMRELVPEDKAAPGNFIVPTHLGTKEALLVHNTGKKKLAEVTTKLGLNSRPSHDHRFLVLNPDLSTKWKKTSELQPGDKIAVKAGKNIWPQETPSTKGYIEKAEKYLRETTTVGPKPKQRTPKLPEELTTSLAKILGYLVAEGHCCKPREQVFYQKDKDALYDFIDCVEDAFGYRPSFTENEKGVCIVDLARRKLVGFLRALGLTEKSPEKVVPPIIRRAPKHLVAAFISAYFEGDGGVEDVEEKQVVAATSKSRVLLQEVQLLLLNMGIVSSLYPPYPERVCWSLHIRSEYVDVYAETIGFISKRKRSVLSNRSSTAKTHVGERLPYAKEALDTFRAENFDGRSCWTKAPCSPRLDKEEYTSKELAEVLHVDFTRICQHVKEGRISGSRRRGAGYDYYIFPLEEVKRFITTYGARVRRTVPARGGWGATYSKLEGADWSFVKERDPILYERIAFLLDTKYIWDEVKEVSLFDYEVPMGDLTVHEDASYIADGLICHNSGSSVSLRILENKFLCYISQLEDMLGFVINMVSAYTGWDRAKAKFRPFKMADDLQRKMFLLQLNQSGKISDKTLLQECDLEVIDEEKLMKGEAERRATMIEAQQKNMAEIQGKAMLTQGKYQQKAEEEALKHQEELGQPQVGEDQGTRMEMNLSGAADRIFNQLQGMAPPDATRYMAALKTRYPDLAEVVTNLVMQQGSQAQGAPEGQMAALPEQKPPRRELSPV